MPDPEPSADHLAVIERARAARYEAERLAELALHAEIEADLAGMPAQTAATRLSPVVEAQLHLRLSNRARQDQDRLGAR